jgi:hypothetical protein
MTRSTTSPVIEIDESPRSTCDAAQDGPESLARRAVSQIVIERKDSPESEWLEEQTLSGLTAVTIAGAG